MYTEEINNKLRFEYMRELPGQLRLAMKDKGIKSAIQLAELSGLDKRTVRQILNGDGNVKLIKVATVAFALGMKLRCVPDET